MKKVRFVLVSLTTLALVMGCITSQKPPESMPLSEMPTGEQEGIPEDVAKQIWGDPQQILGYPQRDVSGSDIADVPRYTGSIRKSYSKDTSDPDSDTTIVSYWLNGDQTDVINQFYIAEMQKKNFELTRVSAEGYGMTPLGYSEKIQWLDFQRGQPWTKGAIKISFEIRGIKVGESQFTEYEIYYEKYK